MPVWLLKHLAQCMYAEVRDRQPDWAVHDGTHERITAIPTSVMQAWSFGEGNFAHELFPGTVIEAPPGTLI